MIAEDRDIVEAALNPAEAAPRVEHDLLGPLEVPADALYGVHTVRALANFPHGGRRLGDVPEFCRALVMVKRSAARANVACGALDPTIGAAIVGACDCLLAEPETLRTNFPLPLLQGGAGTSTNMNTNEVVANRALVRMGHESGEYAFCHPNDHVNRSQSTNDVYPAAFAVALRMRNRDVVAALESLWVALEAVGAKNAGTVKLGRTQLRDAVPMTVEQEFVAWADASRQSAADLDLVAERLLSRINLGGTAIGTGLAAPEGYPAIVAAELSEVSRLDLELAAHPVSATTDTGALLAYSAALRGTAVRLGKLGNDLRLLSSGPRAGLGEIVLPPVQAGSSMMPGKVNPVIPEYVNQLCFRVHGLDHTTALALDSAQLQLIAMLPVAAEALFEAQDSIRMACTALTERCVPGIEINERRLREYAAEGLGELTDAASVLGYDVGSALAKQADRAGISPIEAMRKFESGAGEE
jgi:aspartate ammonia-lyase